MIKYLGSKKKLLPDILAAVRQVTAHGTVVDLFSGTSRVGHMLKGEGYRVLANDHNAYAETLARCYVVADRDDVQRDAEQLLEELQRLPGRPGYFTAQFSERARYLQPHNAARVDAIREAIAVKSLPPELEAVLLVALMQAADRVDSTTGVQMAYLKQWAPRSFNDLELRLPALLPRAAGGKAAAHRLDAHDAAARLQGDVIYVDPPYNQHSYLGNYHVWESLVLWDKPATYGVANKRTDCRQRRSEFNSKARFAAAFERLILALDALALVVSFSNEGYLSRQQLEAILRQRGDVQVVERDYDRYVGARIGIYSPGGVKVGKVSHLTNKECLFVVGAAGGLSAPRRDGAAGTPVG